MSQATKKKPVTHCEKYGHTWVTGTSEGFEVCSYSMYTGKGKSSPCGATRRTPSYAPSVSPLERPVAQPTFHVPDVEQVSLFD